MGTSDHPATYICPLGLFNVGISGSLNRTEDGRDLENTGEVKKPVLTKIIARGIIRSVGKYPTERITLERKKHGHTKIVRAEKKASRL